MEHLDSSNKVGEQKGMGVALTYRKTSVRDHRPNMVIELLLLLLMGCEKSHSRCQYARGSLVALIVVQWKLCGTIRMKHLTRYQEDEDIPK